jgi:hypothetical protein
MEIKQTEKRLLETAERKEKNRRASMLMRTRQEKNNF